MNFVLFPVDGNDNITILVQFYTGWNAVKKVFHVFAIIIILFFGCESDKTTQDSRSQRIGQYTKVLGDYIRDQNSRNCNRLSSGRMTTGRD